MTAVPDDLLRPLVAEAIRAALGDMPAAGGRSVECVRLADDRDLDTFVRRIVSLCDNPRTRQQLVSGQLRFSLSRDVAGSARPRGQGAHRVERGAVTERTVKAVAERGQDLLLSRRAVLTPLARDRARALGVHIEKES